MNWAKYAEIQTKHVVAHPIAAIAPILSFAFIAGANATELLYRQHFHAFDLIFTAIFLFLPIWWSYFVVHAIRDLRDQQSPLPSANE
jgi:hypothetical protein